MLQVIKDNAFPPFPSQVGTIFNTNSVWFSKKGTLMPVTARSQFFLTEKGLVRPRFHSHPPLTHLSLLHP